MTKFIRSVPGGEPGSAPGADRRAFDRDRAIDILARTLYGEARGEGESGMEAVACVIMNRVAVSQAREAAGLGAFWWGRDVASVCLKPYQFSCWNRDDPNRRKIITVTKDDAVFAAAKRIATRAILGLLDDVTFGATHYHARGMTQDQTSAQIPTQIPTWARGVTPVATIGRHIFYKLS
ncbi:MAG: cell wall hydrolase [Alphaproteobacteria bacterium]|nr:cell wall hydrolase [Alphaproteobacteria bacterium]